MKHTDNIKKTDSSVSRREFLRLLSYTAGASVLLSSCEQPIRKAIPYLNQPEEIIPGESLHYASSYCNNGEYAGILVEVRDGRPIKLEGNTSCPVSRGKLNGRIQASLLNTYDVDRLKNPLISGEETTWDVFNSEVIKSLKHLSDNDDKVLLLCSTHSSPSTKEVVKQFCKTYQNVDFLEAGNASYSAIREANQLSFGIDKIPQYSFDDLNLLVSFQADFLNSWLMPLDHARMYAEARSEGRSSYLTHYQIESSMTLTGAAADKRISIHPNEELNWLHEMYKYLQLKVENKEALYKFSNDKVEEIAFSLWENREEALVFSSTNTCDHQILINGINYLLGAYQRHVDFSRSIHSSCCTDSEMREHLDKLKQGQYKGLICYDTNPVYEWPAIAWDKVKGNLEFSLAISSYPNETTALCNNIASTHYYLEAWNDYKPREGFVALQQPVLNALHNTRQGQDLFLNWIGSEKNYLTFLKAYWEETFFKVVKTEQKFSDFWNTSLQQGIVNIPVDNTINLEFRHAVVEDIESINVDTNELILLTVESVALGRGDVSNNPWLYELPDPLTKVCWENYVSISENIAHKYKLKEGDIIILNNSAELPVVIMPGQNDNTLTLAAGYGRTNSGRLSNGFGVNAYQIINRGSKHLRMQSRCGIKKAGRKINLAKSQLYASTNGRDIIKHVSLSQLSNKEKVKNAYQSLYPETKYRAYNWGMTIDLNKCIGCSACVIACQAENNIPVVGKEEAANNRLMHWIRIDRYFSDTEEGVKVDFQPLSCQHCKQAPCENVCPVSATSNTSEGINQMIYNRCIGTRYCSNNCPYKVRRFNWRDYNKADAMKNNTYDPSGMSSELTRLVLNPDVAVRAKGVIEKCSFCYQRIAEKKIASRKSKQAIADIDIQPACVQTCPTGAIKFGNLNNQESTVSKLISTERAYTLLDELHTLPSVHYLAKIDAID